MGFVEGIRKSSLIERIGFLRHSQTIARSISKSRTKAIPPTMYGDSTSFGHLPGAAELSTTQKGISFFPRKPYKCDVSLNITEEQSRQYFESTLRVSVHGKITTLAFLTSTVPL